jgi:hypothetical protein
MREEQLQNMFFPLTNENCCYERDDLFMTLLRSRALYISVATEHSHVCGVMMSDTSTNIDTNLLDTIVCTRGKIMITFDTFFSRWFFFFCFIVWLQNIDFLQCLRTLITTNWLLLLQHLLVRIIIINGFHHINTFSQSHLTTTHLHRL